MDQTLDIISLLQNDKSQLSIAFTTTKEKLAQLLKRIENGQTSPEQLTAMRSEHDAVMKAFSDVVATTRAHIQEAKA